VNSVQTTDRQAPVGAGARAVEMANLRPNSLAVANAAEDAAEAMERMLAKGA